MLQHIVSQVRHGVLAAFRTKAAAWLKIPCILRSQNGSFRNFTKLFQKISYFCSMKITLLVIGKTDEPYLETGIAKYVGRLGHYVPFEMKVIPDIKNRKTLSEAQQKKSEGELLLSQLQPGDLIVLLDENGKTFSSRGFSKWIENQMNVGCKRMVFVIGGPYGFSQEVYEKANSKISLSEMTFSHQMVRLIFVEQLYRAFTILKGEAYHHD